MSGEVSDDFHQEVTHLIVGKVSTPKYHAARLYGKPLLCSSWINDLWSTNFHKYVLFTPHLEF